VRGSHCAFSMCVYAMYFMLPLWALFLLPFINPRRPLSLLHLDLLVLLSFSVSLAFFNHGNVYASTPLVYPPLLYVLARMLWLSRPARAQSAADGTAAAGDGGGGRRDGERDTTLAPAGPRLLIPAPWLALGLVFLLGFRIALNVTDSNVIDVGYAGVI